MCQRRQPGTSIGWEFSRPMRAGSSVSRRGDFSRRRKGLFQSRFADIRGVVRLLGIAFPGSAVARFALHAFVLPSSHRMEGCATFAAGTALSRGHPCKLLSEPALVPPGRRNRVRRLSQCTGGPAALGNSERMTLSCCVDVKSQGAIVQGRIICSSCRVRAAICELPASSPRPAYAERHRKMCLPFILCLPRQTPTFEA